MERQKAKVDVCINGNASGEFKEAALREWPRGSGFGRGTRVVSSVVTRAW